MFCICAPLYLLVLCKFQKCFHVYYHTEISQGETLTTFHRRESLGGIKWLIPGHNAQGQLKKSLK